MSERISRQVTLDALGMVSRRQPPQRLLHLSDRESQHASGDYPTALGRQGIVGRMSRRADCRDKAVAENSFATLKVELVHDALWPTRAAAQGAVSEYIEVFYNLQRRHLSLGFFSPEAFERQWPQQHRAA